MKKKFTFEIEKGSTPSCSECPFNGGVYCGMDYIDCNEYNMHTAKLVEYGK